MSNGTFPHPFRFVCRGRRPCEARRGTSATSRFEPSLTLTLSRQARENTRPWFLCRGRRSKPTPSEPSRILTPCRSTPRYEVRTSRFESFPHPNPLPTGEGKTPASQRPVPNPPPTLTLSRWAREKSAFDLSPFFGNRHRQPFILLI